MQILDLRNCLLHVFNIKIPVSNVYCIYDMHVQYYSNPLLYNPL